MTSPSESQPSCLAKLNTLEKPGDDAGDVSKLQNSNGTKNTILSSPQPSSTIVVKQRMRRHMVEAGNRLSFLASHFQQRPVAMDVAMATAASPKHPMHRRQPSKPLDCHRSLCRRSWHRICLGNRFKAVGEVLEISASNGRRTAARHSLSRHRCVHPSIRAPSVLLPTTPSRNEQLSVYLEPLPSSLYHINTLDSFESALGGFQHSRGHVADALEAGERTVLPQLSRRRYRQATDNRTMARRPPQGHGRARRPAVDIVELGGHIRTRQRLENGLFFVGYLLETLASNRGQKSSSSSLSRPQHNRRCSVNTKELSTLRRTSDDGENEQFIICFPLERWSTLRLVKSPWQPACSMVSMATICFELGDSLPRSISLLFAVGFGAW